MHYLNDQGIFKTGSSQVQVVVGLDTPIRSDFLNPHYTDERFLNRVHTVFLKSGCRVHRDNSGIEVVKKATYVYSDRLKQWYGFEKSEDAWEKAAKKFPNRYTAAFLQEYLRILESDPELELLHILTSFNPMNGYPYRVYGFRKKN